jgi:WD40 repeat protein
VVGSAQREILEVAPGEKLTFYEMPDGHPGVDDIAIRCDGKIWATAGWDGRVRLFNAKKRMALAVLKPHNGGVHTVAFAVEGLLASAGKDRGIALWSLYR